MSKADKSKQQITGGDDISVCCTDETCRCSEQGGRLLEARLLLLLRDEPACGYDLLERLNEIPFGAVDTGAVYRFLRRMEQEGLVKSTWETTSPGPARRIYHITRDGTERLAAWVMSLRQRGAAIAQFIRTYERS